jgi:3-oxoacyl-[acyl-carrier protein] reductase
MNIDLTNKTALICGGSAGIGLATAKLFAESGCSVIILARNRKRLLNALNSLKKKDFQNHQMVIADLQDTNNISKIFDSFFNKNPINILVNNSGGPLPKNILECNIQEFNSVFNQHFLSTHIITKKAIENMIKSKFGRIINISGTSIKEPIPGLGLSAIRIASSSWSKMLSKEVGKYNITVNNILPGPTDTKELKNIVQILAKKEKVNIGDFITSVSKNMDIGRIGLPQEIANFVLFIASEYSSFLTGSNIVIDGGYTHSI